MPTLPCWPHKLLKFIRYRFREESAIIWLLSIFYITYINVISGKNCRTKNVLVSKKYTRRIKLVLLGWTGVSGSVLFFLWLNFLSRKEKLIERNWANRCNDMCWFSFPSKSKFVIGGQFWKQALSFRPELKYMTS